MKDTVSITVRWFLIILTGVVLFDGIAPSYFLFGK